MKVIAINGSIRRNGNTEILIKRIFDKMHRENIETELIHLSNEEIKSCKACFMCGGKKKCVIEDDKFQLLFNKMVKADGILLASPTYGANISSAMQAFLERSAVVVDMNPGLLKHKVGASISCQRRSGALQTIDTMNHFFINHEMFIVGSTYWAMANGQLPGDVLNDQEGLLTIDNLGDNFVYLLKRIKKE